MIWYRGNETMRSICWLAIVILTAAVGMGQETSRVVAGGGISVPGWTGKIDAGEEKAGQALNNAKLVRRAALCKSLRGRQ